MKSCSRGLIPLGMGLGFRVQGFGFRVLGLRSWLGVHMYI